MTEGGEFQIILKGDAEYKLTGKPGCTISEISEYVTSSLLKYTCHNLYNNGKKMESNDKVDELARPVVLELKYKSYSEYEARTHVEKIAKGLLLQDTVFEKALAAQSDGLFLKMSDLVDDPKESPLKLTNRTLTLEDITNGVLFYFSYKNEEIVANVNGFYHSDKCYSNLVSLLMEVFKVTEFQPLSDITSFKDYSWISYQSLAKVSFVDKFSGLNDNLVVDTFVDLNNEVQSLRDVGLSKDCTDADALNIEKSLFMLKSKFQQMAVNGVIGISQGGLLPVNPTESRDTHIYIWNNLFFGLVGDWYDRYTNSEYNKDVANIANANKELESINYLATLNLPNLSTMMTCLIGFAGKKYLVQTILGNSFKDMLQAPVVFGNIQKDDEALKFISNDAIKINEIASAAQLKMMKHSESFESCFHEETRITECNNKFYLSDVVRTTPIDALAFERFENSKITPIHDIMYYRRELITSYEVALQKPFEFSLQDEIKDLGIYLKSVIIPTFVLEALLTNNPIICNSYLCDKLHAYGINIRHLGLIHDLVESLKCADVASAIKSLYAGIMETSSSLFSISSTNELPKLALNSYLLDRVENLLNLIKSEIFGRSFKSVFIIDAVDLSVPESKSLFVKMINNLSNSQELIKMMNRKFLKQVDPTISIALLRRICECVGIRLNKSGLIKMEQNDFNFESSNVASFLINLKTSTHSINALKHFTQDNEKLSAAMSYLYGNTSFEVLNSRSRSAVNLVEYMNNKDSKTKDVESLTGPLMDEMLVVVQYFENTVGPFAYETVMALVF